VNYANRKKNGSWTTKRITHPKGTGKYPQKNLENLFGSLFGLYERWNKQLILGKEDKS